MAKLYIGVPVFNGEATIGAALDSVLSQQFEDWTLLISDNASTDGTEVICREFAERDPRIRYHRQTHNVGAWNNFKFLLAQADCPYFTWLSDDFVMKPEYLQVCVKRLEDDAGIGASTTHIVMCDENGEPRNLHTEAYKIIQHGDRGRQLVISYLLSKEIALLIMSVFRTGHIRACMQPYSEESIFRLGVDAYVVLRAVSRMGLAVHPEFLLQIPYDHRWARRTLTFEQASLGGGFGFYFFAQSMKALPWKYRPAGFVILWTRLCISIAYKLTWGLFLHGPRGVMRKAANVRRVFSTKRLGDDTDQRTHD